MSEQTLRRILVGVGVLVVASVLVVVAGDGGDAGEGGAGAVAELLEDLDPDRIRELAFSEDGDTLRLRLVEGTWRVNGYRADSARIAGFRESLAEARVTGPVARNPSNHARLGVSADSAARLVVREEDGEERILLVGQSGPARPSAYVRVPDRDAVHLVHVDLRGAVARSVEGWRDRTIVRLDTARVRTLILSREGGDETLHRRDAGWSLDDGTQADGETVRGILGALAGLRATAFAPDTASLGQADRRLAALGPDGDTLTVLSLAGMELPGARIRARESPTIYELTTYQLDRLFPEPETLRGGSGGGG